MSDMQEHLSEMVEREQFAVIEDVTGNIKSGVELVRQFMYEQVQIWGFEAHEESLKGAANRGKMEILWALEQEFNSFADALGTINYLDHEHEDIEDYMEQQNNSETEVVDVNG